MNRIALLLIIVSSIAPRAIAVQAHASGASHTSSTGAVDNEPHPQLPAEVTWPGSVVIVILGMFLAAMVIGPMVRLMMPPEAPEPVSHHDAHRDSHAPESHSHHGH
ncbi:MAG: hypothetical protein ACREJC_05325 [Tepidisphaeraceae bacterium]